MLWRSSSGAVVWWFHPTPQRSISTLAFDGQKKRQNGTRQLNAEEQKWVGSMMPRCTKGMESTESMEPMGSMETMESTEST